MINRAILFLLPCLTIGAVAPAASAGALDEAFGNTIVSTYPDGRKAELYLDQGGSYTAKGRRADSSDGHWTLKGEKLCLKQAHPFAPPISFCTPLPTGGVGSAWTAKAVTGEKIDVTIVKGHV